MTNEKKNWTQKVQSKAAVLAVILSGGVLMSASAGDPFETSKQLEVFTAVLQQVQTSYVDDVGPEQAVGSAIEGMLQELDPYTVYYPEDKIEDVRLIQTGEYGGVGCVIQNIDKNIYISDVIPSGPAGKAGLRVGDVLKKVGTTAVPGLSISEVSELLKGTPGSEVRLTVDRFSEGEQVLVFNRDKISSDPVPYYGMRDDGIGYIYLESFTDKAATQVRKALNDLAKEKPKGLILDLRGNGGGLLMEAVKIVSYLSDTKDTIVSTRGRGGVIQDVYKKAAKSILPNVPLAVLVDRSSASASEIVAGAIQDLDRGVILGEKSFGKGLVQQIKPLPFGAQMKVTVAKYYTPSGRCIQKVNYDRNEQGKRTKKAEQRTFSTRAGRRVVDGDGVHPDSTFEDSFYPEFVIALHAEGMDLKFAGRVLGAMDTEAEPREFEMDDKLWDAFTAFLDEASFEYESLSERQLARLKEEAALMDYITEEDVNELVRKIENRKGQVLEEQREEIAEYLADYLVQKNFALRGSVERGMHNDTQIQTAAKILLSEHTMERLLSVN